MSKFDYDRSAATADRLIDKFGQQGTITRMENIGQPWKPVQSKVNYPCRLVVLSYTAKDIDGTLIKAGDKKVYVSAIGLKIEPKTTDKLVINGKENTIISVDQLNPAGTPVYYVCQCRS